MEAWCILQVKIRENRNSLEIEIRAPPYFYCFQPSFQNFLLSFFFRFVFSPYFLIKAAQI